MTTADLPLASLPPHARIGQARAELEALCLDLCDRGALPHELRCGADTLAVQLSCLSRLPPEWQRAARDLWRSGLRLAEAIAEVERERRRTKLTTTKEQP